MSDMIAPTPTPPLLRLQLIFSLLSFWGVQHMVFLGTERYPVEGSYEAFLNEHGGSSNAYTAMEDTNYYFSVRAR